MDLDPLLLARVQFAFTIAFHIIFPSFTIGLAAYIATLEALWLRSNDDKYMKLARFWTKIFAVSFAMGVVSGIVLSYQIGTNWSRFSEVTGNVIGPLLGYEVLTAFFLEATFLGVMLFGWERVPRWLHFTASLMVAIGTSISAFWILSANSWMQTPAGYEMRDGIVFPVDWWAIVFNPSFPYRFAHMLTAAYLTTAFVVFAVAARYLLENRYRPFARTMLRMALGMIIVLAPAQAVIGDFHGLNTLEHQPAKVAAMEGHWDGSEPGKLLFFAWPDEEAETNRFEIGIPGAASFILKHDWNGLFKGLSDFPPSERPPVLPVFFGFRIMVGIGLFMILMGAIGGVLWWRGRLLDQRLYLRVASLTWPLGFIAVIAGWTTTETGRQPWLATGIIRTADAVSPVPGASVAVSLALFVLVYGIVFSAGIYYLNRLLIRGPDPDGLSGGGLGVANRPLSGAGRREPGVSPAE